MIDLDHRTAMVRHSMHKMLEQFGLVLTETQYDVLCAGIRADCYPAIAVDAQGQTVYQITYRDQRMGAVWNKANDCIRTFLVSHGGGKPRSEGSAIARAIRVFAGRGG